MAQALYHELAPFYDRIYSAKEYRTEANRLIALARRTMGRAPRSLLDVGCGTGRHLAEFHRLVPEVAGVDLSAPMLCEARRRLGPGVMLRRGDMRSFRIPRTYDVVVCLFSAIGYLLRRGERDRAAANFFQHVSPGGVVLVEGWVRPAAWRPGTLHLQTYDGPDAKVARLSSSSRTGGISTIEMHYLVGVPGRPVRHLVERHRNALVDPEEMLGSFRRAGFRARVDLRGPYRDRGLYVGVRPGSARAG